MRILALDLATATGWACSNADGQPTFGTKILPSTGDDVGRFGLAFNIWLRDTIALENPDMVVFESAIMTSGKTSFQTARKLIGLAWHVEYVCAELSISCREAHIGQVKSFFAGHGRADKDAMMHVARKYGWDVKSDHEADALAILAYSSHKVAPEHSARFSLGPMGARASA